MDLGAELAQRIFVPFYERRWGIEVSSELAELQRSQFYPRDQLEELQWTRLRAMLEFAEQNSPFYRSRFAQIGLEARGLAGPEDLRAIPLLTKDDLRNHRAEILAEGADPTRMLAKRTGGSTGVPVRLVWDQNAHRFKRALVKRHDLWAGYRLGDRMAALWGDTEKRLPLKERIYQRLCQRTEYLDTLQLDESHMDAFLKRLRRFRPRILMGHAHSIYFLTEYLRDRSIEDIRFDSIISTAEALLPAERERIESYFGKVLFDRYGCEELSLVASECERHDGLHIASEGLYVEVQEGGDGQPGPIVVSDLTNFGMPLIRYEVGDLATFAEGECACGRSLPRLARVHGRTTDMLFTPDGRRISGVSILDTFMIHVPGIRQAQIVQDRIDHLVLRVVPDAGFGQATLEKLRSTVVQIFGGEMGCDVETVEAIAPTPRGKYQFTICRIEDPSAA